MCDIIQGFDKITKKSNILNAGFFNKIGTKTTINYSFSNFDHVSTKNCDTNYQSCQVKVIVRFFKIFFTRSNAPKALLF